MSPWNERDGSRLSGRERSLARRFASAIGKLLIFKHGNGLEPYRRVKKGSRRRAIYRRGIAFGKMMLPKRARMDSTGWHRLAWRRCHGRLRGDFRGFGRLTDGKRETS